MATHPPPAAEPSDEQKHRLEQFIEEEGHSRGWPSDRRRRRCLAGLVK